MSTIPTLVGPGLKEVDGRLRANQQKQRVIYTVPTAPLAFKKILEESEDPVWLQKQFVAILNTFISGGPIHYDAPLPSIKHMRSGIWEMKTSNLRIFGFFHAKDVFVIIKVTLKTFLVSPKIYNQAIDDCLVDRDLLAIADPKHIQSKSLLDVISV